MDILLLIIGILGLLLGLAGAILPTPGPPLSFGGMIALHYSRFAEFSQETLIVFGVLTVVVTVLDYYVPVWGTRKFGGSKWGMYGSGIGLLVGLFLGPAGLFVGAFAGAFVGEFLHQQDPARSFRAAVGSFVGLMAGIVMKVCIAMLVWGAIAIFQNI